MFHFINIELFPVTVGPEVSGVVLTGEGASPEPYREGRATPSDLPVPWRNLQPNPDVFSLLQWRTAISKFAGREAEMDALKEWANSDLPISAKFVTGEGGVGKTRLAAELAMELRNDGWAAGFPDLRSPSAYFANKTGSLLIVDYPEEHPGGLDSLFTGLARLEEDQSTRLRVLFLSRREAEAWRPLALDTNADAMIDWVPVPVGPLRGEAAYSVFHSALERASEAENTVPPPVSMEVLDAWLEHAPENDRALFIVAAATYCALHPDEPIVDYKGRDVVLALVEREVARLRRTAKGAGLRPDALSQLLAFAAIRDGLDAESVYELASNSELEVQFPSWTSIVQALGPTAWLTDDGVPAPKPDILAAALVIEVFRSNPNRAPDWLWAGIEDNVPGRLETLGRLSHDAEVVLGLCDRTLSEIAHGEDDVTLTAWLRDAFWGKPDRCRAAQEFLADSSLPLGLVPVKIAVWRTLLDVAADDLETARLLNNLSNSLFEAGDESGALDAIYESVEIFRRLAATRPEHCEPDLAKSLNNLSNRLSTVGDAAGALKAIREALAICRRIAVTSPERYEPDLASSLNNLSNRLSNGGDAVEALAAAHESVEIRRRLAAATPARYEPDLASSLNNLSNRLTAVEDAAGALDAIREAVEIRRQLAATSPARYEPHLAESLHNLSTCLSLVGDSAGALAACDQAVEIRRTLANVSPERFEPLLASSISNRAEYLRTLGDSVGALDAIREAISLIKPFTGRYPDGLHAKWLKSMEQNLQLLLSEQEQHT